MGGQGGNVLNPIWVERRKRVLEEIPGVFDNKSVLYIGANARAFGLGDDVLANSDVVDIVEIDPGRCDEMRGVAGIRNVVRADISTYAKHVDHYDAVMWFSGPSVIPSRSLALDTVDVLAEKADRLLLIMVPFGQRPYTWEEVKRMSEEYPLHYDWMRGVYYERDFSKYNTFTIGPQDGPTSSLWVWRLR